MKWDENCDDRHCGCAAEFLSTSGAGNANSMSHMKVTRRALLLSALLLHFFRYAAVAHTGRRQQAGKNRRERKVTLLFQHVKMAMTTKYKDRGDDSCQDGNHDKCTEGGDDLRCEDTVPTTTTTRSTSSMTTATFTIPTNTDGATSTEMLRTKVERPKLIEQMMIASRGRRR